SSTINWSWLWLVVAAFLGGALNAVAGGGTFLLFPAILGMGTLPVAANATNTVALWPGQMTSIAAYREDVRKNLRIVWPMSLAALIGSTAGALILLHTPQKTFMRMVPWLLLAAACIFAASGPVAAWLERRKATAVHPAHRRRLPVFLATIALGFYLGYFGAGSGFLIITMLSLFGWQDLHEINALKVVTTTVANGVAFVIFTISGQVLWRYCLLAMFAAAIGGYGAARFARKVPQQILRTIVVVIGLAMAAWFFWKQ
ncbi:MAG: sulfite exporter TauE/SafE family protein, partial [Terracidiphilus sp.]